MNTKFLSKEHDTVAGFHHVCAGIAGHLSRALLDVIEGPTSSLSRVRHAALKSCRFCLEVNGEDPHRLRHKKKFPFKNAQLSTDSPMIQKRAGLNGHMTDTLLKV